MPLSHIVIRAGGASPCRHVEFSMHTQLARHVLMLHGML